MYPRGSNGAGQAIIDAKILTDSLSLESDEVAAFLKYEKERLPKTTAIVRANRTNPPDAILREVYKRTGDQPFKSMKDVMTKNELYELSDQYKKIAGFQVSMT